MDLSFEQISKEFEILGYTKEESAELAELAMRDWCGKSDEEIERIQEVWTEIVLGREDFYKQIWKWL